MTKERINLNVGFATPILMDNFYVMYPREDDQGIVKAITKPLEPFASDVWYMIIGVMLWVAFLYTLGDFYAAWTMKNTKLGSTEVS